MSVNTILKYSSKGFALMRKQLACSIDDFAREGLKGVKLPSGAKSYDAVRVGKNVKGVFTDIFTFRDEMGNMVGRYTQKFDGDDITQTFKTIKNLCDDQVDIGNDVISLIGKNARGYKRVNGKITECFDETITKAETVNPIVTTFKRLFTPEKETIKLAEYQHGNSAKFLENQYRAFRGSRNVYDDEYVTKYVLESTKASSKEMAELASNSYLLPLVSPRNKFINRVVTPIFNERDFVIDPGVKTFKLRSSKAGKFDGLTIHVNKINKQGLPRQREELVTTIGHEAGHALWDDLASSYDMVKAGVGTYEEFGITPDKLDAIKKYAKSMKNYIRSEEDFAGYQKQFCERMARAEGLKSRQNYMDLEYKLNDTFPYRHFNQFYPSKNEGLEADGMDDILRLFADMKNLKDLM